MEISAHRGEFSVSTKIKIEMWKEKIKHRKGKKVRKEKKTHTEGGKKNRHLIFLLFVGDKLEIFKFTCNTIKCLMNIIIFSCWFWENLVLKRCVLGKFLGPKHFLHPWLYRTKIFLCAQHGNSTRKAGRKQSLSG